MILCWGGAGEICRVHLKILCCWLQTKMKICLKELRESQINLKILEQANLIIDDEMNEFTFINSSAKIDYNVHIFENVISPFHHMKSFSLMTCFRLHTLSYNVIYGAP